MTGVNGERVRYLSGLTDSSRWDGFALRPGDIVISTPAKSGTTWMQMICALLLFQTADLPAPLTTLSPWLDSRLRPIAEVRAALDAQRHRRFIKTHTPLDGLPVGPGVTYVVVGRDPRDVVVSHHHHLANLDLDVIRPLLGEPVAEDAPKEGAAADGPQELRERLPEWLTSEDAPQVKLGTLRGIAWHLAGAWSRRHDPDVVLVHYGDLAGDLGAEMRRIAGRLGIGLPEETWPALVEAATFDRMRARAHDLVPDERVGAFLDRDRFFRSGSSGQWREVFTAEDLARYEERIAALAPPDLVRWLHHGRTGADPSMHPPT